MYALILAGGRGERLRPLTDGIPKPMVPVLGQPLLWHQVQWLKRGGVTHAVFLTGYRSEVVEQYFGNGDRAGIRTDYSVEASPLGRGGAIRLGFSRVPPSANPMVVVNGDTIITQPLRDLVAHHHRAKARNPNLLASMLVAPMISPYTLVHHDNQDRVTGFEPSAELPCWVNAGAYVFERGIEDLLPQLGDHETETFPGLAAAGRISACRTRKFWRGVDSIDDLRVVEEYLTSSEAAV